MDSTVLASHGDVTGRPGAAVAAALAALPPSELVSARKAGTGDAAAPTPTASAASTEPLGLTDVVDALEAHLQDSEHRDTPLHKRVELKRILEAYDHSLMEWKRFCMFDEFKYTRNLVATDNETYTLMLLCWSPGQASPIHDHPCDGCWVKVLQGSMREVRYQVCKETNKLTECETDMYHVGQVAYIDDSIALHKMGNASTEEPAVTLHLYSPPFAQCRIWLDEADATKCMRPTMTYYSEFGRRVQYGS